ncbi:uncharacterized protein Z518_07660 [Rhinocladiella mackenziei CBS 650.93]|uniref:Rgp1-domain-containing protein n=1 Tax=Rhinocladiella mackenziei CBS 650.93 TaxID=1442369 RepID=A0A0D2FPJ1_9EURO|nr:uncharacterized protein Z518_07660 [Rhinocladiella mackenziei CBS 650.93]KIX04107.1 hypothetical protein Z518_07660 [Rhinocladiella mackenziei CBS 650.93]
MHSDIHVVVRFHDQSVFTGEHLRCTITFKNVANLSEPVTPAFHPRRSSRHESISQIAAVAQATKNNAAAVRLSQNGRSASSEHSTDQPSRHRATASSHSPGLPRDNQPHPPRPNHKAQRSVSIISVTSPIAASDLADNSVHSGARQLRLGHQRASTVQIHHVPQPQRMTGHQRRDSPTGLHPPPKGGRHSPLSPAASGSRESTPDFKFPLDQPDKSSSAAGPDELLNPGPIEPEGHAARTTSGTSQVASDRSSGDFYSLSNHSQETLMSEQPSVMSEVRPVLNYVTPLPRRPAAKSPKPQAVNLLMGYAQLSATFTLDASLIDASHFEEVKSKGFLGGQAGGGVVGVQKSRPNSHGFLGNFNFNINNIGGSLNSLMTGGGHMSSVKEMNAVTNSRAIPLLSTPQSLLFVDLHLEPGEEQSYSYTYPLPRGLPSSHRGKAIKISYTLTVGVQGLPAAGGRDTNMHAVRQVNVPIRVFSGVNYDGEIFGHDLMQPHVILQDLARTKSISSPDNLQEETGTSTVRSDENSTTEFLQFVDTLLDRNRRRQSSTGTMDPHLMNTDKDMGDSRKAVQAINRAIFFSNQLQDESSPNRFEIARNGLRVAVIVVDRPLHRLGETVTAVVDFSEGQIPCASLRSTLETCEKVSPSLAVRSAATINRVTRKVYAGKSDIVLFTKRATFAPSIPATATPTFVTSGVSLDWSLRFEFGTIKQQPSIEAEADESKNEDDGKMDSRSKMAAPELLEEVVNDERGAINVAVENLDCETFEVIIPITVYGDLVLDGKEGEEVVGIPI